MRTAAADDTRLWLTTDTTPKKLLRTDLVASGGMAWDETVTAPAPPTPPACPAPPTDGGTAEPGGSETTSPTLALPASGVPLPSPGPGLPGVTTTTTPTVTPTTASVLQRLLGRTRTSLRRAGLRGLLRRGSVAARVGGLPSGRVVLRVELLRPGRRALVVAGGSADPRSGRR
jgi:hypothetical protein